MGSAGLCTHTWIWILVPPLTRYVTWQMTHSTSLESVSDWHLPNKVVMMIEIKTNNKLASLLKHYMPDAMLSI